MECVYIKIIYLLKQRNVSMSKMSKDIGVNRNTIKKWEFGNPSIKNLISVAKYLDVSVDFILDLQEKNTII